MGKFFLENNIYQKDHVKEPTALNLGDQWREVKKNS